MITTITKIQTITNGSESYTNLTIKELYQIQYLMLKYHNIKLGFSTGKGKTDLFKIIEKEE